MGHKLAKLPQSRKNKDTDLDIVTLANRIRRWIHLKSLHVLLKTLIFGATVSILNCMKKLYDSSINILFQPVSKHSFKIYNKIWAKKEEIFVLRVIHLFSNKIRSATSLYELDLLLTVDSAQSQHSSLCLLSTGSALPISVCSYTLLYYNI